jgi:hypothetical protein
MSKTNPLIMKTVFKFVFTAACIGLLVACDKSDPLNVDLSGNDLKKASANCPEIVVEPETGFDTENLVAAYEEAKSLGAGTTIRLTEGTYTIGMIEVHDFDGVLTGAGQGKTIIRNLSNLPCEEMWQVNQLPSLLTFIGGNVVVSNMTFHLNDGEPCERGTLQDQIYGDLGSVVVLADYSLSYVPENRHINGVIDNVDFIAGSDGGWGTYGTEGNVAMAVYCGTPLWWVAEFMPLSIGEISVTNCTFKDVLVGPDFWAFNENSSINAEGNVIEGGFQQIFIGGMVGAMLNIKNNKFEKGTFADLYIEGGDQGYYPDLFPAFETKYNISGNKFMTPPGVTSMYITDNYRLKDPDNVSPQLYDVKGNVFNSGEGGTAIMAINTKNARIWNNQFLGTGSVGVMLDGDEPTGTFSEGNQLTGNNFLGATFSDAAVYLGPVTRNNKVAGMSSDKVVDEGTGNLIIGTKANKQGVPPLRPLFKNIKPLR